MTVRPPQRYQPKPESVSAALDYEIAQEKASTLGRMGRQLEAAIAALAAFDAEQPAELTDERKAQRRRLVAEAGSALWHFVVQREALGLRDSARLLRDYKVPNEVRDRMGAFPPR
ncbi:hypothetical protein GJW-30_1_03470 [Variibacter gotjawalensis]|uniref:Uncharacterized protein n=1 Tax=Variibacter gotjawalensis TaxID=1333996 RepID=A0A0S3PYA0_9BRAD|nr:DUF6665 family protein [Variibacter gotjawalensis]NIK46756.1 hypothetical protein [Variibacter gotjawalensis]RZS48660.1 hypothetical protein EV661_1075 [Variibacter gotjawalensis]BAT60920.1 hypothetical protein GJW-30_1_03470 [Variibacter gotjawalensis]